MVTMTIFLVVSTNLGVCCMLRSKDKFTCLAGLAETDGNVESA